jgi:hypothetical protein
MKWEANVLFAHTAGGLGSSVVTIYFIPVSLASLSYVRNSLLNQ